MKYYCSCIEGYVWNDLMHYNFYHIDEVGYEVITYNTGRSIIGRFVDTVVEENNDQFPDQCVIIFRVLAIGQF